MKLFLDSSFFFPLIRVEVKELQKQDELNLLSDEKFRIFRSELVTFELSAKGTKFVSNGILDIEDVIDGLNLIVYNSSIDVIPIHHSEIQILAASLRGEHTDFIDCLTLASAVHYADIFLTLDEVLCGKSQKNWSQLLTQINENFSVELWRNFLKTM